MKKVLFTLALVLTAGMMWAEDAHFNLIGSFSGCSWEQTDKNKPLNKSYENQTSKYYIDVDITAGDTYYFALNNGGDRYAPSTGGAENKELNMDALKSYNPVEAAKGKGAEAWYNAERNNENVSNNSWKFTAPYTGKLRICVDESGNDQHWYPYVWVERPAYCLMGGAISGENTWDAANHSTPIRNVLAENKFYIDLNLNKDTYFALNFREKRWAPATSPVEIGATATLEGSRDNGQDNSWKFTADNQPVRLIVDLTAGDLNPVVTLQPFQLYLIGQPLSGDNIWGANNTSAPIALNYGENGKYYIDVQLNQYCYFALSDGVRRYAPAESGDINVGDAAVQGDFEDAHKDNSWKYCGNATTRRICIDLNNMANPYMWIESQKMFVIGNPIDGDNTWNADAANKRELTHWDGNLAYVDCYMTKDSYFALSDGSKRYNAATQHQDPATATVGVYAPANDNSWKYVGNTGLVHLVIDKTNGSKFPTVQVTRPEVLLRHPWNGTDWSQSEAMTDNGDGTYTLVKEFSGRADGYSVYTSYEGQHMNEANEKLTIIGSPEVGDKCQFYVVTDKANGPAWYTTVTKYQTVTYDGNGKTSGDVPASAEVLHGENVTIAGQGNLARDGYTFAGWNTKADGTGETIEAGDRALEATMTLYAKWEPITYTLTLAGNGGSDGAGSIVFEAKTATITTAPEQAGKFLSGYYAEEAATTHVMNADGSLVANVAGYTNAEGEWIKAENTALYAGWASAGTLTVSAGEHGSIITPAGTHQYADVLLQAYNIEATADEGYVFDGWTAAPAENVTITDASAAATTATVTTQSNITVTASFRAINYIVSFDKNGGEGDDMTAEAFTYTEEKALTANTYTRAGYYFMGWATAADGEVVYADGAEVSRLTATDNDEVKLFAVWTCKYVLRGSLNEQDNPHGGMPGWSTTTTGMTPADGVLAQQVLTLEAQKEYKFKFNIVEGDKWLGQIGDGHLGDDTEWTLNGSNDIYLSTTVAGDYTFQIVRLEEGKPVVKVLFADHGVQYTIYTGATTPSAGLGTVEVHVGEQVLHNGDTFNPGADLTFVGTANDGYYLKGWSWNKDETSLAGGWDGYLGNAVADAKAYAIFRPRYTICGSLYEAEDPKGGMPGWGKDAIEDYVVNGKTFSKTYTLEADKEYKFKLYDYARNDQWLGQTTSCGRMHAEEKWTLNGGNDILFTTGAAGEYTFVIDFSSNVETPSVSIIYPEERTMDVKLNKDGFASLYMPYNFTLPTDVKAYKGQVVKEEIVLTEIAQEAIRKETGVILYSASHRNETLVMTEAFEAVAAIEGNAFTGSLTEVESIEAYVLAEYGEPAVTCFLYVQAAWNVTLPAYRAYLPTTGTGAPMRIRFATENATGVDDANANEDENANVNKVMVNGQLLIIRGENKYNALGVKLQ